MATSTEDKILIQQLVVTVNGLISNAKNILSLTDMATLDPTAKIAVEKTGGDDESLTIQKIIDAAAVSPGGLSGDVQFNDGAGGITGVGGFNYDIANSILLLQSQLEIFEQSLPAPYQTDDFESGLSPYTTFGDGSWAIDTGEFQEGVQSVKSGSIGNGQFTSLQRILAPISKNSVITFYYKTSTETNFDFLEFYINDVLFTDSTANNFKDGDTGFSGEIDWTFTRFPVRSIELFKGLLVIGVEYIINNYQSGDDFTNVGAASNANGVVFTATGTTPTTWTNNTVLFQSNKYTWRYVKDTDVTGFSDAVWIDNVNFHESNFAIKSSGLSLFEGNNIFTGNTIFEGFVSGETKFQNDITVNNITIGRGGANGGLHTVMGSNVAPNLINTASFVTILGFEAGVNCTDTNLTTLVGHKAGNSITSGNHNTGIGTSALRGVVTGRANTVLGIKLSDHSPTMSNHVILLDGDSVEVFKSNNLREITLPQLTIPLINSAGNLSAVTKEYVDYIIGGSGGITLKGTWDASIGTFPGGGIGTAGDSYIVSVGGTVDSVTFDVDDRILALVDNASTTTFAGEWHKLDYTDKVLSVAGKTGAVTLVPTDAGLGNVTNDSQLKRGPSDINSFPAKSIPTITDVLLLEDASDSFNKKRVEIGNLPFSSIISIPVFSVGNSASGLSITVPTGDPTNVGTVGYRLSTSLLEANEDQMGNTAIVYKDILDVTQSTYLDEVNDKFLFPSNLNTFGLSYVSYIIRVVLKVDIASTSNTTTKYYVRLRREVDDSIIAEAQFSQSDFPVQNDIPIKTEFSTFVEGEADPFVVDGAYFDILNDSNSSDAVTLQDVSIRIFRG